MELVLIVPMNVRLFALSCGHTLPTAPFRPCALCEKQAVLGGRQSLELSETLGVSRSHTKHPSKFLDGPQRPCEPQKTFFGG